MSFSQTDLIKERLDKMFNESTKAVQKGGLFADSLLLFLHTGKGGRKIDRLCSLSLVSERSMHFMVVPLNLMILSMVGKIKLIVN
jgi:hypothetical protein